MQNQDLSYGTDGEPDGGFSSIEAMSIPIGYEEAREQANEEVTEAVDEARAEFDPREVSFGVGSSSIEENTPQVNSEVINRVFAGVVGTADSTPFSRERVRSEDFYADNVNGPLTDLMAILEHNRGVLSDNVTNFIDNNSTLLGEISAARPSNHEAFTALVTDSNAEKIYGSNGILNFLLAFKRAVALLSSGDLAALKSGSNNRIRIDIETSSTARSASYRYTQEAPTYPTRVQTQPDEPEAEEPMAPATTEAAEPESEEAVAQAPVEAETEAEEPVAPATPEADDPPAAPADQILSPHTTQEEVNDLLRSMSQEEVNDLLRSMSWQERVDIYSNNPNLDITAVGRLVIAEMNMDDIRTATVSLLLDQYSIPDRAQLSIVESDHIFPAYIYEKLFNHRSMLTFAVPIAIINKLPRLTERDASALSYQIRDFIYRLRTTHRPENLAQLLHPLLIAINNSNFDFRDTFITRTCELFGLDVETLDLSGSN